MKKLGEAVNEVRFNPVDGASRNRNADVVLMGGSSGFDIPKFTVY